MSAIKAGGGDRRSLVILEHFFLVSEFSYLFVLSLILLIVWSTVQFSFLTFQYEYLWISNYISRKYGQIIYNLDKRWKFIIQRKCVHIKAELICVFVLKNQQSRDDYCPVYQVLNLISWLNTVCHCLHFSDARTFWNKSLIFEKWWMLKILN